MRNSATLAQDRTREPGVNILMVDDRADNLLALRAVLDDRSYNLVDARSGEEALELMAKHDFAVVLLDVYMHGLDGFETARRIRSREQAQHTPIIFLTAYDTERTVVEQAYALGAVDFLIKPFAPVVLRAKVAGLVELFTAKEQAKRQAEQYRLVLESTTDYAIFMLDPEGRVISWNVGAERIKGYRADEIIGQHFSRFYPADAIARDWPAHELRVATAVGKYEEEGWRLRKDGSRFWANVLITAVRDKAGKLQGFSKITRDLTERKRAEENTLRLHEQQTLSAALKEADRKKDEFLAMLAHELRNPLAPIRNAVELLRATAPPVPEVQWVREIIDRQVRQMTRLVDDLLDASRIAKGKLVVRKERIVLAAVIASAVEASRPMIEKGKHELTVRTPTEPIHLHADPDRLCQVLQNLLNNAAKYTEEGGHIYLTVEADGDNVLIRVKDTGIGIPAEVMPRIFDLFAQVDRSLDRAQGGLGIGLSLVKTLVEMHHGTVTVRSDGPGRGSEFVVSLPVAVEVKFDATHCATVASES
jgi:PAS domain S-box-containing protein